MAPDRSGVDLGSRLRAARERRGVSLRQIAGATKISVSALEALERNDLSRLPGGIFSRAFVRSYASEVGLDPDEAIQDFLAQFPHDVTATHHQPAEPVEDHDAVESDRRTASTFLRLTIISLPIAAAVMYFGIAGRPTPVAQPGTPTATEVRSEAPPPPAPPIPPVSTGAVTEVASTAHTLPARGKEPTATSLVKPAIAALPERPAPPVAPTDAREDEAAHLTVSRYNWLVDQLGRSTAVPPTLVPTEQLVEHLRVRKDADEIEIFREAARRLSAVARGVFEEIKAGRTEQEVARAIDARIIAGGFERTSFDTIVASGPQAALPHAHPTERMLGENDLVVLDFGGVYRSYCVDLTRTVAVGRASSRAREVHAAVLEAHDRAIQAVAPGRSRFAIDAAARDSLTSKGFGEAFGHGTGHGLGIEIHEDPRITRRTGEAARAGSEGNEVDEAVAPGMVFTIEPGAYLPGWGGVRIEDDVLVTEHGVELLTNVTTDLLEL